jgi:hypothetical protein
MPPRLAKLLAAVVALALIVAAFLVRARISDDEDDAGDPASSGTPRVVCVTELEEICDGLDGLDVVRVEDAGATADALEEGPADFDAWVTFDPWPAMVDFVRGQAQQPELFEEVAPVASSRLVLVLAGQELPETCGWDCAVEESNDQREIGIPDGGSGFGVQVVAAALSDHLETTDFSLDSIRDESGWLERLLAFRPADDAVDRMALQGVAAYQAAGTVEALARPAIDSLRGQRSDLRLGRPEVPARIDVVVAPVRGAGGVADRIRGQNAWKALAEAGWTVPATDGPTGLPAADLLVALREETDR